MPFRPGHLPREKAERVGQDRLLNPASCPPALMVLGQLKANTGMEQTPMAPVLTLGWQLHTYAALVSLSYYPLGAKSHSGQWAESQCGQHQRILGDRSTLSFVKPIPY